MRTARSSKPRRLASLAVLLGLAGGLLLVVGGAPAAPTLPPPTITSAPANPSSSTTATFAFSESQSGVTFQCRLDNGTQASCASPKTYTGLAAGSHTFMVTAFDNKGKASPPTSYSWSVDLTPPTVSSIARADPSPRNSGPLHWTVSFSEPVGGLAAANFALASSGLTGAAPTITSAIPAGSAPSTTWTVTVSTTGTAGSNGGSIGLNLANAGAITDAAGNALATSSLAGQAYTYDTTAPSVTSINRAGPSPTAATSVSWTVVFSEPVTGVALAGFSLVSSGFSGTPALTALSGSGTTWTLTSSTASGTTTNAATLELRLASAGSIADAAANALAGVPVNGQTYTVDRLAPPAPVFTVKPPDPTSSATSHFAWTVTPLPSDFDHYECNTENGAFSTTVHAPVGSNQTCASPLTYAVGTTSNGQHQFGVRAVDALGNYSETDYTWKVAAGSGQEFTIDGNAVGLLQPGGTARPIAVTLHNPNGVAIYVTALTVAANADTPAGCSHNDLVLQQADLATANVSAGAIVVPAGGAVTLPAQNVAAPTIRLLDNGADQTAACANGTFSLSYTGSAHS